VVLLRLPASVTNGVMTIQVTFCPIAASPKIQYITRKCFAPGTICLPMPI